MNKESKLIIEALTAFTSVALLFWAEKYVIGSVILLIIIALSLYYFWKQYHGPIKCISLHWHMEMLDSVGHEAHLTKDKIVEARERNIQQLTDIRFTVEPPGRLILLRSSLGSAEEVPHVGSGLKVITYLDAPLKLRRKTQHLLEFMVLDGYTDHRGEFSQLLVEPYKKVSFSIRFSHDRPARNPILIQTYKGRDERNEKLTISEDGISISFVEKRPKIGTTYHFSWNW